eukprot:GFUD01031740.1.p1 GENE.GFUD01031740.1~~GFUD01031740.1.p1  ORF type:complete len:257 (+),score=92.69 GFUD01031740.1:74-844(+)
MLEDQPEFCDDVIVRTRDCGAGLAALRDETKNIISCLKVKDNQDNVYASKGVDERVREVTETLERLDVGVKESNIITTLAEHFDIIESDQSMSKLETMRVKDENDWLRDELEDTEKRLEDTLVNLAGLEEEKKHWLFMEEVRMSEEEADIRPVTPSKIPVGAFRVEEEKAINRALSAGPGQGSADSNRRAVERSSSPAAPSRIPKFASGLGASYRRTQEKIEKAANEQQENRQQMFGKHHKLSLTPATSYSSIPGR